MKDFVRSKNIDKGTDEHLRNILKSISLKKNPIALIDAPAVVGYILKELNQKNSSAKKHNSSRQKP